MALHFDILANGKRIGYFVAQRQEVLVPRNGSCHYNVSIVYNEVKYHADSVKHNYNDGALVLVFRALGAVLNP